MSAVTDQALCCALGAAAAARLAAANAIEDVEVATFAESSLRERERVERVRLQVVEDECAAVEMTARLAAMRTAAAEAAERKSSAVAAAAAAAKTRKAAAAAALHEVS